MQLDKSKIDNIKLVVSDLDGTLLNKSSFLSSYNHDVVMKLKDSGILFTFATGRMDRMTWHFAEQLDIHDLPVISCNGALVRYVNQERTVYWKHFTRAQVEKITELAYGKADYLFYGLDEVYYTRGSKRIEVFHNYNDLARESGQAEIETVCLNDLPGHMPQLEVTKVYLVLPEGEAGLKLKEDIAKIEGLDITTSKPGTAEFMPTGVSKGTAVEVLANKLGLSMDNVLCLGDQKNDVSMLAKAGISIGMRSGVEEILPHVDLLAEHHNADGLGRILTQIFEL